MSTSVTSPGRNIGTIHLVVTTIAAAVIHAPLMVIGYKYHLGYASLATGAALVVILLSIWALAGSPKRLERTSLGVALVAAASLPAWWAGWPLVLGLPAAGLALAYRQRVGSLSRTSSIGLALGVITFGVGVVFCLSG